MSEPLYQSVSWTWESHLVTRLGINRDELRALREQLLTLGVDYQFKKNRVEISPAGLNKLVTHLRIGTPPPEGVQTVGLSETRAVQSDAKNAAGGGAQAAPGVLLHVWRTFQKNRHIIEAFKPGTDPQKWQSRLRVKVKDSTRFSRMDNTGKPMALLCRHLQADFYEHVGPLPRRKGRV